ncbi:MAG: SDR family oxidoreductase [Candidatus Eisenbacteria bacterium]
MSAPERPPEPPAARPIAPPPGVDRSGERLFPFLPDGIFAGRSALVTGGGTGLGLAVSTRLGRLGARVACASRDPRRHERLIQTGSEEGFEVLSFACDVRDPHAVRRAVRATVTAFGGLDVLVNNAAGNFVRPALALAPKAFASVIDVALNGVFYVSREAALVMRERGGGAIVNVSAPYARDGKPGVVHSACAKAGVETMTRTLAAEWAPHGIRVNAVSPGPFASRGAADRLWPSIEHEEEVRRKIPSGRFGAPEEIAELVCFLASPAAGWIMGAVLLADGGFSLPAPLLEGATERGIARRRGAADAAGKPEEPAGG